MNLSEEVLQSVQEVLPADDSVKPLHSPTFQGKEWEYVKETIDTTWVSSAGKYVEEFQKQLELFTGFSHAIAIVNGTAALQLALEVTGVKRNDEVLVPSLTFAATANAISHTGAHPHFIDVDEKTLGIDVEKLEEYLERITSITDKGTINKQTGRVISAIVPVHTFGHPASSGEIREIADRYNLKVIEDAAEALGSFDQRGHVGKHADAAVLSFNGNKVITTGGGGAILTDDAKFAERLVHLSTTAKVQDRFEFIHDEIGYNFRMPNLNAALGCAQLEQLPSFLEKKRSLAERYEQVFQNIQGVTYYKERAGVISNYWLQTIILDHADIEVRNEILEKLHDHKLLARPVWRPLHQLRMYEENPRMNLSMTEELYQRIINLPSGVME